MSRFLRVRAPFARIPELAVLYSAFLKMEYGQPGYLLVADSCFLIYSNGYLYEDEILNPRYLLSSYHAREHTLRQEFDILAQLLLLNRMEHIDPELLAVRSKEVLEQLAIFDYAVNAAEGRSLNEAKLVN